MTRILLLARTPVAPEGRPYQLAGALGRLLPGSEVTLAAPAVHDAAATPAPNVRIARCRRSGKAAALARAHDVTIARTFAPQFARLLGERRFALDAGTRLLPGWLDGATRRRGGSMAAHRWNLNFQLTLADFVVCTSDRQRDLWIGMLMALALVPPDVYERDPSLRRLIDVVPAPPDGAESAWDAAAEPLARFCAGGESWAMPAGRRRLQAYTRAAVSIANRRVCGPGSPVPHP